MATRQLIVDDFDGTQPALTYQFALEGVDYEIDLSEDNLGTLRAALAPFIAAGRRRPKNTKPQRGRRPTSPHPATDRSHNAAVRTWWTDNWQALGLPEPTSHLGPIPARVRDAYNNALEDTHHQADHDSPSRNELFTEPPAHH